MLHQAVIPLIAALLHIDRNRCASLALHDDDVLDRRGVLEGFVRHLLQRNDLAAAVPAVGGNEQHRFGVVDPIAKRFSAEAAEDDAVHRADSGAGQHGDRQLGNQRQVQGDAVAAFDAE